MRVEEPAAESFLHRLWERQIAGKFLRTTDGRTVEILSPGVRNYDAGPDYRNATIRLDGKLAHGDIEVHPEVTDWERHGHHRDPAYNRVILHIVTSGCPSGARTLRADGASVPIVDLDRHLPAPAEDLERRDRPEPASHRACLLADRTAEQKLRVIQEAALQRLEMKAERFREERLVSDWDQVAYRGILEALGYSKNQAPARRLGDLMPVGELWRFTQRLSDSEALARLQAWLLGAAGLLEVEQVPDPVAETFLQAQRSLWLAYPRRAKVDPLHPEDWRFFRLRPANFPTRRIAAVAVLLVRYRQEGFVESWARLLRLAPRLGARLARELEQTLVVNAFDFWSERDCFLTGKSPRAGHAPQLLGSDRARDIAVNIVLPLTLAYAEESGDGVLRAAVEEAYRTYPKHASNEILRTMTDRVFQGSPGAARYVRTAAQQQGLIQLYKFGCRVGDCSFCEGTVAFPGAGTELRR